MLFQYNNEPYYKPERSCMSKTVSKYLNSYGGKDKKRGHSCNARRVGDEKRMKKKVYCSCNNKVQCNSSMCSSMEEVYYVSENERLQKEIAEYQRKIAIADKQIQMLEEWKRGLIKEKVYAYAYAYESEQHNFKQSNNNNNNSSSSHVNTIQTLSMTCTDTNND